MPTSGMLVSRRQPARQAPLQFGAIIVQSWSWLVITLAALAGIVSWFVIIVHEPSTDLVQIVLYFIVGGSAATALGYGTVWAMNAIRGRLWLKLMLPAMLSAAIIGMHILLVARLMFISLTDSLLAGSFLLFSSLLGLGLATGIARTLSHSLEQVERGARTVSAGDYSYRIPEQSLLTEVNQIARSFNEMAANIAESIEQRRRLSQSRQHIIAALSHDVRTPIATIRAMVEAIDDGIVTDTQTVTRYHQAIRAELRHLSRLVDDLFEVSRIEAGTLRLQFRSVRVEDLISDVLAAYHSLAERQQVLLFGDVMEPLPPIQADPGHLYRVLDNLVSNALHYTPAGGAIGIRATVDSGRQHMCLDICDAGTGVAGEELPYIFELAYRGESARQRTNPGETESHGGLGLAIARGIIEAHGGLIAAQSPLQPEWRQWLEQHSESSQLEHPGTVVSIHLPVMQ